MSKRKVIDYVVVRDEVAESLADRVNDFLADGYELHGVTNVQTAEHGECASIVQAMVKKER